MVPQDSVAYQDFQERKDDRVRGAQWDQRDLLDVQVPGERSDFLEHLEK